MMQLRFCDALFVIFPYKITPLSLSLSDMEIIQMLAKKVETLNKAMEVEAKKMRREVATLEKEVAVMRNGKEQDQRNRRSSATRGSVIVSHTHSIR